MNIQAFASELEALVVKHGAVLGDPVSMAIDPPMQSVTEMGPVTYTTRITPMKIHFSIKALYTEEFKEYWARKRGAHS